MKSAPRTAGSTEFYGHFPAPEWMMAEADEERRRKASDELERRRSRPSELLPERGFILS